MKKAIIIILAALLMLSVFVACDNEDIVDSLLGYMVTFDANGGEGEMEDQTIPKNGTTLNPNEFTRKDYFFVCWNTQEDGEGTSYVDKAEIKLTEGITLYAQWMHSESVITFDANGGEGEMEMQIVLTNVPTELNLNEFTREEYLFGSWNTDPDGEGESYEDGEVAAIDGNTTLYAQWIQPLVIYDANGGEGEIEPQIVPCGVPTVLDPDEEAIWREGYEFTEWNTDPEGRGDSYDAGDKVTIFDDLTLYAMWKGDKVQVKFDANGGAAVKKVLEVVVGQPYGDELPQKSIKKNYEFDGWWTEREGGTEVDEYTIVTYPYDHTLYAHWRPATYEINYELKFKDAVIDPSEDVREYEYGVGATLPSKVTKEGYVFNGWYDNDTYQGEPVTAVSETDSGDKTFYARWKKTGVEYLTDKTIAWQDGYTYSLDPKTTDPLVIADRITVTGDVTLILPDGMTLTASKGINVSNGNKLTIEGGKDGTGKLIATGEGHAAGIGGQYDAYDSNKQNSGIITIKGGDVTVEGGENGAGIGGGYHGVGGKTIISGGTVKATGGEKAAGIGGGNDGAGGEVEISGGNITANGGSYSAGIGGGNNKGGGTVSITGGSVIATAGENATEGIGEGNGGTESGTLEIGEGLGLYGGADKDNLVYVSGPTKEYKGERDAYMKAEALTSYVTITYKPNGAKETTDKTQKVPTGVNAKLEANTFTHNTLSFAGWSTSEKGDVVYQDEAIDKFDKDTTLFAQWTDVLPLTLEFPTAGNVTITNTGNPGTVKYSINGGAKTDAISGTPIEVPANGKISFYRTLGANLSMSDYFKIACSVDCYVYGSVMSLIDEVDYASATKVLYEYAFFSLFDSNSHIKNHPTKELVLPATTLTNYCYGFMFSGCTGLTEAPELPAMTMATNCYYGMFKGCTSLTTAPELPATTLAEYCYRQMFSNCSSLTTAPELPVTTLAPHCYQLMFNKCTGLTTAPELPATTLTDYCYESMFYGCSSLTAAPDLPAATLTPCCYMYMFYGCGNINAITCLATDISAANCTTFWLYNVSATGTFTRSASMTGWTTGDKGIPSGWTVKKYEQSLPLSFEFLEASTDAFIINNPASKSLEYSINGGEWQAYSATSKISVSEGDKVSFRSDGTGSSSDNPEKNMTIKCNADCTVYGNVMSLIKKEGFENEITLDTNYEFCELFYENTHLMSAEGLVLPATTLTIHCYHSMFSKCYNLTTAPELPANTMAGQCYYYMFNSCTSLTKAPELPATTLAQSCYASMFNGCSSLTTAPVLPAETLVSTCYGNMFKGCSSLNSITCLATTGISGNCNSWVSGVAATGTFTRRNSSVEWTAGESGYPSGWTLKDYYK